MNYAKCAQVLVVVLLLNSGCAGDPAVETTSADNEHADNEHASNSGGRINTPPPPTVGGHAHPSHGPHEGELIELGNEEYHAELLHDNASVTIYVLNAAATETVPIDATEIHINLKHDGQPEQFALTASPDDDDPAGKSSRFVLSDAELVGHLEEEGTEPQLVLTIDGESYRGTIEHSHDHGHSHSHD